MLRTVKDNLRVLSADKYRPDAIDGNPRRKICLSLSSGCRVGCIYCFTRNYPVFRPLAVREIVEQAELILIRPAPPIKHPKNLKFSFKQMGDPLLNPVSTCEAVSLLARQFPAASFVVSTSGPRNPAFFRRLQRVAESGARTRLQFSCHTTSDEERVRLSPALPMMRFDEIAAVANNWNGERVSLNFVMLAGFSYDAEVLKQKFDPAKVFIKISRLDPNSQIAKSGLKDLKKAEVLKFTRALETAGFTLAFRQ